MIKNAQFSIVFLDVKTTDKTSFKLFEDEIVCFDENDKFLKKI